MTPQRHHHTPTLRTRRWLCQRAAPRALTFEYCVRRNFGAPRPLRGVRHHPYSSNLHAVYDARVRAHHCCQPHGLPAICHMISPHLGVRAFAPRLMPSVLVAPLSCFDWALCCTRNKPGEQATRNSPTNAALARL